ncbi:MAG: DNA polymerase III subunit delta [Oscillospiraceae bacterium]|jgi:DNA polymerase-3 subunit delta|nr:DNA polymerase III subunit delta [Oscillospiraceae bacterium]
MPGYKEVVKSIKEGQIAKLYVFHGEEAYLREHCLEQLREAVVADASFDYVRLSGKGLTLTALTDETESLPFMGKRRLVVADDFDLTGIPAAERDRWTAFFETLPDTCCLVFFYDTLTYKQDARSKITAALKSHAVTVEFAPQGDSPLIAWITRHFSSRGVAIDRSTCEYMIFRCGRSMTMLRGEIEKTAAYCRESGFVTRAVLDEVTEPVLEATAFNLTDAVAAGDMKKAANLLETLQWMREPPEMILGALGKTLRGLYVARLAIDHGKTIKQVMDVCGYRSAYPAEKLMRAAKGVPAERCRAALLRCREADGMLKGEGRERALEWLLGALSV